MGRIRTRYGTYPDTLWDVSDYVMGRIRLRYETYPDTFMDRFLQILYDAVPGKRLSL